MIQSELTVLRVEEDGRSGSDVKREKESNNDLPCSELLNYLLSHIL